MYLLNNEKISLPIADIPVIGAKLLPVCKEREKGALNEGYRPAYFAVHSYKIKCK
jgi:hypothetical protein